MPPLNDEELEQIIADQMPGYTVVSRGGPAPPAAPPEADQIAADIGELRQRYLDESPADAAAREPELDTQAEDDEEVVTVAPAGAADALNPGARKQVIVSASEGRIIGSQG
jgi:hypothetical protein